MTTDPTPTPEGPARDVSERATFDLDEFIQRHVMRRDGWCQECGRWPLAKGGPCPVVAALAAEQVAHAAGITNERWATDSWRTRYEHAEAALTQALEERDEALATVRLWAPMVDAIRHPTAGNDAEVEYDIATTDGPGGTE